MNKQLKHFSVFILVGIQIIYGFRCENKSDVKIDYKSKKKVVMECSKDSILKTLDQSIEGTYNDFIDLGHGYFELANSRLHLFKNENEWALVFEKCGYNARASTGMEIQVYYFGNCLENLEVFNDEVCNQKYFDIENNIYESIESGSPLIKIRDETYKIPLDKATYKSYKIDWRGDKKLYEGAVLKYLAEVKPDLTRATVKELRMCIPEQLKEIMVIDNWYQQTYTHSDPQVPPSKQETFQMIAKVLETGDTSYYKPTKKSNTHWSNWLDSGKL